jgi:hypothetical protein
LLVIKEKDVTLIDGEKTKEYVYQSAMEVLSPKLPPSHSQTTSYHTIV